MKLEDHEGKQQRLRKQPQGRKRKQLHGQKRKQQRLYSNAAAGSERKAAKA